MIHAMRSAPAIPDRPDTPDTTPRTTFPTLEHFVGLSVALTGFDRAELFATGMVDRYLGELMSTLDDSLVGELLKRWAAIMALAPEQREAQLVSTILSDATLGPIARNLTMLWYLGQWTQLPREWRDVHGANARDVDRIVSAEAYRESLVWVTFGGHPQGAKAPGFGSWAMEPPIQRTP
jgi:hypothetical protein